MGYDVIMGDSFRSGNGGDNCKTQEEIMLDELNKSLPKIVADGNKLHKENERLKTENKWLTKENIQLREELEQVIKERDEYRRQASESEEWYCQGNSEVNNRGLGNDGWGSYS